jgi:F1F0 ATPase subunit 2
MKPMNSAFNILAALVEGALLGALFYVGLWLTVRKGLSSAHPALLFLASLILRVTAVVAGFYYISHGEWRLLAASLGGFLISRTCALWIVGGSGSKLNQISHGDES